MRQWKLNNFEKGLVSVIIPTYNRQEFLTEAVESIIAQTYRPIECIIVDDGSTDNTKVAIEEIINRTDKEFILKYIYQSNAGSQTARNAGTAASTGEFIQYLDSDDILYPDKLKQQVNYLQQHKDCDGVFGDWQAGTFEKKETVTAYKDADFITQMLTARCIANFSFLMRRYIIEEIGDWDVSIKRNQEIDFHLRGVLKGGRFDYSAGICGLWHTHTAERIGNKTESSSTIKFYHKWEKILRTNELWNCNIQIGIANNYIWFLKENKNKKDVELRNLLIEIQRLNPEHTIFNSKKFKLVQKFAGNRIAINAWIKIYKRESNNG